MNRHIENEILDAVAFDDDIGLDALQESLQTELKEQFSDLDILQEEREHINNPDHLGETVMNVVWEQFMNQVVTTAGEDFIKEKHGLHLDLRDEAALDAYNKFYKTNGTLYEAEYERFGPC